MLEDPRINFAISKRGAEARSRPSRRAGRIEATNSPRCANKCAQAGDRCAGPGRRGLLLRKSDKYWVTDPQGIAWETFHTLDSVPVYGESERAETKAACCESTSTVTPGLSKSGGLRVKQSTWILKAPLKTDFFFRALADSARSIMAEANP